MTSVGVDQLTHIWPLVGTLLDDLAIVLEQVVDEKLVELLSWTVLVFIHLLSQTLAEEQGVDETILLRVEFFEEHQQVSVEDGNLIGSLIESLHNGIEL
jgi:hypothetical protein